VLPPEDKSRVTSIVTLGTALNSLGQPFHSSGQHLMAHNLKKGKKAQHLFPF